MKKSPPSSLLSLPPSLFPSEATLSSLLPFSKPQPPLCLCNFHLSFAPREHTAQRHYPLHSCLFLAPPLVLVCLCVASGATAQSESAFLCVTCKGSLGHKCCVERERDRDRSAILLLFSSLLLSSLLLSPSVRSLSLSVQKFSLSLCEPNKRNASSLALN